jgi:hypothetical protein
MMNAMTMSAMTMSAMMTAATMRVTMTMAETKETKETAAIRSDELVRAGILIGPPVLSRRINNRTGAPTPPVAQPRGARRCNRA